MEARIYLDEEADSLLLRHDPGDRYGVDVSDERSYA